MKYPNEQNEKELENLNAQSVGKLEDVLGKNDPLFSGINDATDDFPLTQEQIDELNREEDEARAIEADTFKAWPVPGELNPDKSNEDGEIDHEVDAPTQSEQANSAHD